MRPSFERARRALQGASLRAAPFGEVLDGVQHSDFVYLDPPYTVTHNNNGFVRYNELLFRWHDQLELAAWARGHAAKGGQVIITNAAHEEVIRQYPGSVFLRFAISRSSRMAADPRYRRNFTELMLVSRTLISRNDLVRLATECRIDASDIDG